MTTVTFQDVPFYYNEANKYPYIDKISVGKDDHKTDFIYQFVKNIFFNQLNNRYTSYFNNIIGPPTLKPYTARLDEVDPKSTDYQCPNCIGGNMNTRFINIEFHEAVYPIKVCMHVINHIDDLVRIWAQNSDNQWFLLWHEHIIIYEERNNLRRKVFSPSLQPYKFKTKMLRLEFQNSSWRSDYSDYTKLNAVLLIGTSELIVPKSPKQDLIYLLENIRYSSRDVPNLTSNNIFYHEDIYYLQKNFRKYCIISIRNTDSFRQCELGYKQVSQSSKQEYNHCFLLEDESKCKKFKKDIHLSDFSSDESKELSHCSFSMLPNEIILKIFKKLDLKALICVSRVNKRLNILSRDPLLYKNLNIRDAHFSYWNSDLPTKFRYFAPRCKYLQQLDLSFCLFFVSEFIVFLDTCGRHLTYLKLNHCCFIDDITICKISEICKNLKGLELNYCPFVTSEGISYLERLEFLERLHLQGMIRIETYTLCNVLQRNRQMRDLNIQDVLIDPDAVAIELKNSCPNLERINFTFNNDITWQAIDALADCKNLQELNIEGFINEEAWNSDSFYRLLSSCQRLENINLEYCRAFIDRDLRALIVCKNLKYLNLSGIDSVTPDICSEILLKCPKLEKIILRDCGNISECLIDQWNEEYQHVLFVSYYLSII